jgi:DNA polymerase III alpha subunit (gram-positive type)
MERVRKGKRLQGANLPEMPERDMRVLDQCRHIDYLYPKAHAVEHILFRLRARDW